MKQFIIWVISLFLSLGGFAQETPKTNEQNRAKTKSKTKTITPLKPKKEEAETVKKIGPPRNVQIEPQPEPHATHR